MATLLTRRSRIPGSRFNPTDLELVHHLSRRIERNKTCRFITDMNVYEKEPWLLQHVVHPRFKKNVWFYFVTRKKPPGIKKSDSTRPSRKVVGSGRWKTTGLFTKIKDEDGVVKVGSVQSITFKANIKGKKDEITTGWVMHEFLLNKPGFQEVVLCKIRFIPGEDNAQYAPRLEPIVIEDGALVPHQQQQPPPEEGAREDGLALVESKEQKEERFNHLVSLTDFQGLGQGMDLPQLPMAFQGPWIGSCSGEAVSYSAAQHQQFMGHDSNYPMNEGMEQHQDFGSYGQGFGDMAHHEYQNQFLGQEMDPWQVPMMNQALNEEQQWNGYSGPYSAQPYLGQDMVPMTQGIMVHHQQEQYLAAQHQDFGSCDQFLGESLGQQQNQIIGQQATHLSPMEQQQWNGYSGPYSAQPYDQGMLPVTQGMMEHQDFGPSALCFAQSNQYLGQNYDLSVVLMETQQGMEPQQHDNSCFGHNGGDLAADQQQHLGQDSDLSLTQQQNQILGQAAHLSSMDHEQQFCQTDYQNQALEEQHYGPHSAQQYLGQDIDVPTVPMETQQQDNVIGNLPAQLQLERKQETDLPVNQGINEPLGGAIVGSSTHNEISLGDETAITDQEMDSEMANFGNEEWAQGLGENTPEEEAELMASLGNCNTLKSLLNYFCPM